MTAYGLHRVPLVVTHKEVFGLTQDRKRALEVLAKMKEEEKKWIFKEIHDEENRLIRRIGIRKKKRYENK